MKVKDVNLKKIEQLLNQTDDELYVINISFQGSEPVLNLFKPFDDTELKQRKYNEALAGIIEWIKELDERNGFV